MRLIVECRIRFRPCGTFSVAWTRFFSVGPTPLYLRLSSPLLRSLLAEPWTQSQSRGKAKWPRAACHGVGTKVRCRKRRHRVATHPTWLKMYRRCFTLVNLDFSVYKRRNRQFFFFPGTPTVVKTNILIRSMGPVSELDMVGLACRTCK